MKDLNILASSLAVASRHCSGRRRILETQRPRRQTADLPFAEPGPSCEDIHHRSVGARNCLNGCPGDRSVKKPRKLLRRQRAAVMPTIRVDVQSREVRQRIGWEATIPNQPSRKPFGRLQVVVVSLGAAPGASQLPEEIKSAAG